MTKRHLGHGLATLLAVLAAVALSAGPARAGTWVQVSCENPSGSAAPSEGWSGGTSGGGAPVASVQCSPGTPMTAELSTLVGAPAGSEAHLVYQPPAGSTLVGGTLQGTLSATASGSNFGSTSYAGLYEPDFNSSFVICAALFPCNKSNGTDTLSGQFALPTDRGGDLGVKAGCESSNGTQCNLPQQQNGTWAVAQIAWARLLLSSSVSPQGSGFSGSALNRRVRGTGHLVFTASEPAGPGIYQVAVALGGRIVWAGTPTANGGECAPVGSAPSGALMFDYQQPCLTSEVVDVPVPTRGLQDGQHELAITVADAAHNASTVLDQTINTFNPQTTPAPRHGLRARFVISWHWNGATTRLRAISVSHLPLAAGVSVACAGPGCPRLRLHHVNAPQIHRLLRALTGVRLQAGDQLRLTVSERHHRPERIQLNIRPGREPLARLL